MSTTTNAGFFECSRCHKRHPWSLKIAGKTGRCKCGQRMAVPTEPLTENEPSTVAPIEPPALDALYDLAADAAQVEQHAVPLQAAPVSFQAPPASRGKPMAVARAEDDPPSPPTAVDTSRLPPLRKGLKKEEKAPPKPQPVWQYLILPIVLIVAGLILTPIGAAATPDTWKNFADVAPAAFGGLVAELTFVLLGIFAVSAVGGVSFDEPLWRVGLKLCAVATLPGPVGQLVQNAVGEVGGSILGNFAQLSLYFGLFIVLFRQAIADTVVCVFAIFIIRVLVAYVMFRIQGARLGTGI